MNRRKRCPKCGRLAYVTIYRDGSKCYDHAAKVRVIAGIPFREVNDYCFMASPESMAKSAKKEVTA